MIEDDLSTIITGLQLSGNTEGFEEFILRSGGRIVEAGEEGFFRTSEEVEVCPMKEPDGKIGYLEYIRI